MFVDLRALSGLFSCTPSLKPAPGLKNRVLARIQNSSLAPAAAQAGPAPFYQKLTAAAACLAVALSALLAAHAHSTPRLEVLAPHQVTLSSSRTDEQSGSSLFSYFMTPQQQALLEQDDDQTLDVFYASLEKSMM